MIVWVEYIDGLLGKVLFDVVFEMIWFELISEGVIKLFLMVYKIFVNNLVFKFFVWVVYVYFDVYDFLVDNGLVIIIKNLSVNIDE